jgi:hypothetical protein
VKEKKIIICVLIFFRDLHLYTTVHGRFFITFDRDQPTSDQILQYIVCYIDFKLGCESVLNSTCCTSLMKHYGRRIPSPPPVSLFNSLKIQFYPQKIWFSFTELFQYRKICVFQPFKISVRIYRSFF